jgi:type III pantothenate kinase
LSNPFHSKLSYNLALIIGNSRLHWGWFEQHQLLYTWHTPHLEEPITELPTHLFPAAITQFLTGSVSVYIVSVVPEQTRLWATYPQKIIITREEIPLRNTYATLGNDRALCAYGAGETYGYPVLVIDGGTALTYTAVGKQRQFLGGAILPGLRLQLQALGQQTAALPEIALPEILPPLWATSTGSAIASGTLHTLLSGIHHYVTVWQQQQSDSVIVLTGGDAIPLYAYLQEKYPALAQEIIVDQTLMFQGIANLIST